MNARYEIVHNDDDTYDVVAHYENRIEAWGSFDTKAEARASIAEHQTGLNRQ